MSVQDDELLDQVWIAHGGLERWNSFITTVHSWEKRYFDHGKTAGVQTTAA
jgi:hypothetical protein